MPSSGATPPSIASRTVVRALEDEDLDEAARVVRLAFGTFLGVPDPSSFWNDRDYVHSRLTFGYQHASVTRTAWEGFREQRGVCRDFAHLAITLCRCMNIPARYCTGYLGDIGIPPEDLPMDFSAWFEAYLGGRWYTFDARHNIPRIGRILIARGRDAADVAISTTFGQTFLKSFVVTTREVEQEALFSDEAPGRRFSTGIA